MPNSIKIIRNYLQKSYYQKFFARKNFVDEACLQNF